MLCVRDARGSSACCGRLGLADSPCPCGGVVRLPAALDVVDHVLNRDADRAALQTEVLRNELRRHVGEDHTGGGVVEEGVLAVDDPRVFVPVSYTHLTLPTIYSV